MVASSSQGRGHDLRVSAGARTALVVGGGICGSTVAAVLAQAGWQVTLLDASATHTQHLAAALTPVISRDDNPRAQLARQATQRADRFWRTLEPGLANPCGALQLQRAPDDRRVQDLKAQVLAFNRPDWAHWLDRDQASNRAGLPLPRGGIWYPKGWLVRVPRLLDVLQRTPGVRRLGGWVGSLQHGPLGWQACDEQGELLACASVAVLANAFDVLGLLARSGLQAVLADCPRLARLHRVAGEVTLLPSAALDGGPRCVVAGDGYVLPAVDGWCVSGGTYAHDQTEARCTDGGRALNVQRAMRLLGLTTMPALGDLSALGGWAGWRAVLPGRLPVIGALPGVTQLWAFTAAASRGLTWSVFGAELIRDALEGQAPVVSGQLLSEISP